MLLKNRIKTEDFEYEFLCSEAYSERYDSVRGKIHFVLEGYRQDPECEAIVKEIHAMLWVHRGKMLQYIPKDTEWWLAELDEFEFAELLPIQASSWQETFGNGCSIESIANAIMQGEQLQSSHTQKCKEILQEISLETSKQKLILLSAKPADFEMNLLGKSPKVILEGNHRAVAFQMQQKQNSRADLIAKEVIVGISSGMHKCKWYA